MTTRRLVLIRHSKAASGTTDIERPLADRGRADAAAVGGWLSSHHVTPDLVIVSPALRAEQTWQLAAKAAGSTSKLTVEPRVYDNTVADLLEVIQETSDDVTTLALVGHNPSMGELAARLDDGSGDTRFRQALLEGYPTSGVAIFEVSTNWSLVDVGTAKVVGVAAPRG
jgi:phosphohistidine phosphatase